jgi:glycolate oxidase FAD binding subunit
LPRDLLLGLEFVNAARDDSGGRTRRQNVAGFDLSRLLTGSWGTLGVITEATLRLYARPAVDRTFVIDRWTRETGHRNSASDRDLAAQSPRCC